MAGIVVDVGVERGRGVEPPVAGLPRQLGAEVRLETNLVCD